MLVCLFVCMHLCACMYVHRLLYSYMQLYALVETTKQWGIFVHLMNLTEPFDHFMKGLKDSGCVPLQWTHWWMIDDCKAVAWALRLPCPNCWLLLFSLWNASIAIRLFRVAEARCLKAIARILCGGCCPPPCRCQIVETIHVDLAIMGPKVVYRLQIACIKSG